ncbi:DUF4218 domain-containing protein [Plasmodiophora brassicae]
MVMDYVEFCTVTHTCQSGKLDSCNRCHVRRRRVRSCGASKYPGLFLYASADVQHSGSEKYAAFLQRDEGMSQMSAPLISGRSKSFARCTGIWKQPWTFRSAARTNSSASDVASVARVEFPALACMRNGTKFDVDHHLFDISDLPLDIERLPLPSKQTCNEPLDERT